MAKLTVEYYKINYNLNNQLSFVEPNDEKEVLNNLWNNIYKLGNNYIKMDEPSYYDIEDSDKFIEFIEVTDDYLFGILGKSDEVSKGILKRIKNNGKLEVSGLFLEKYNYFYLRRKDLAINVIRNSQSPGFKYPFNLFINSNKTDRFKSMSVTRLLDEGIESKINKIQNLANISMIFDNESNLGRDMLSMKNSLFLSNNNLLKANISIKLKNEVVSDELKDLMLSEDRIKSDFEKFEITANTPDGQQTIELVNRWLVKSVEIDFDDEDLIEDNLVKIKEALEESFIN